MNKKITKVILNIFFIGVLFNIKEIKANPYVSEGPYGTNCTWYAWKMANEKGGISLPSWGNAKDWYNDAKNSGYSVGTTPQANSIVVWGNWTPYGVQFPQTPQANSIVVWGHWTPYGHVGYVESIGENIINVWDSSEICIDEEDEDFINCEANSVDESGDRYCREHAKRIACKYTLSPDAYGITGYIYLDYAPTVVIPSNNEFQQTQEEPTATIKSTNNNLSNIEISDATIEFNKDVLQYSIDVKYEIEKMTINAVAEDDKSIITGTGNYDLKVGENEIKLVVTAEDETTKEYIIKITRKEKNTINVQTKDKTKTNKIVKKSSNWMIVVSIGIFLIIVSIIIIVFKKKKKTK